MVTLAVLAPALLAARLQLGFPTVSSVSGIPVAFHGFYFFTGVAVGAGGFAAFRRGETVAASATLAVAGLGGFEFLYGVAYATSTSQASLLVPRSLLSEFVDTIITNSRGRRMKVESAAELSRREQEVLDSLLENLANKEIASKLNISERTVKFHVSNLLSKFGVRRRADLILLCYQRRKVSP